MSKVKRSLDDSDFYKSYRLRMKEKNLKPKTKKDYLNFVTVMGSVFADEILKNGIVQLPWGIGDVLLRDKKEPVPHFGNGENKKPLFNDHTNGVIKRFFWYSKDRKNKKVRSWALSPERKMKRRLAVELITNKKEYPDFAKILNIK